MKGEAELMAVQLLRGVVGGKRGRSSRCLSVGWSSTYNPWNPLGYYSIYFQGSYIEGSTSNVTEGLKLELSHTNWYLCNI